jgi:hypothetical protein
MNTGKDAEEFVEGVSVANKMSMSSKLNLTRLLVNLTEKYNNPSR